MQVLKPFFPKLDCFFPTPKFLSFNPVAIDISPNYVRVMQLNQTTKGLIPKFYKEIKLKNRCDITEIGGKKDINTEAVKEVLDALRSLKKEFKLKYIICSLPEVKTYIFRTQLPAEAASDVASAVRFSLEENVPLKVDTVNFDYFVVDSDEERGQGAPIDVVVNVFPKGIIMAYTKVLKMAGLFPLSFQAESVALSRALVPLNDRHAYLLIRLLEDRVGVAIVEDEAVQYASSMNISAKDISEKYDGEAALELREELNKLLVFWFTNKKNVVQHDKIQTVLITGEYAKANGMEEFLERHLKVNVEVGNVWSNCFSTDKFIPNIKQKDALNFSVAIGLAIKAIRHY